MISKEMYQYIEKIEIIPIYENEFIRILVILKNDYVFKLNGYQCMMFYNFDDMQKFFDYGVE